jgi:hypothetical protein
MTEEEYEYKYTGAFTRFGLARKEGQFSVPSATVTAGARSYGDYVPKGTAVLTTGLGKEISAIGNTLVYKPVGKSELQTLRGLVSMEKTPNGYVWKDASGRENLLKTSPGDELWYLGVTENKGLGLLDPEKIQINMIRSIRVEPDSTPERKIKYCAIRTQNGTFLSPREFVFFSVNEKDGAPPVMTLKKDLNRFSKKGYASLLMMKKLTVLKDGDALDVAVQYPGDDAEEFTIDGDFAVYAMGVGGEVYQLKREELQEIEVLSK